MVDLIKRLFQYQGSVLFLFLNIVLRTVFEITKNIVLLLSKN